MIVKKWMDGIEGEQVARKGKGRREWTPIEANLGGAIAAARARRQAWRLVSHNKPKSGPLSDPSALLTDWISEHSRLLASIRGYIPNSLIFPIQLM
jgi:hypothetical protein